MSLTEAEQIALDRAEERLDSITHCKLRIKATLKADPDHPRAADYRARLDDYADALTRWGKRAAVLTAKSKERE